MPRLGIQNICWEFPKWYENSAGPEYLLIETLYKSLGANALIAIVSQERPFST